MPGCEDDVGGACGYGDGSVNVVQGRGWALVSHGKGVWIIRDEVEEDVMSWLRMGCHRVL